MFDAIQVDCPKCGAKAGEDCININPKSAFHNPRWRAYNLAKPVTGRLDGIKLRVYNKGSNPSGSCKQNNHAQCTGLTARKHGMQFRCTCHCHPRRGE